MILWCRSLFLEVPRGDDGDEGEHVKGRYTEKVKADCVCVLRERSQRQACGVDARAVAMRVSKLLSAESMYESRQTELLPVADVVARS